jgi:hypothetical protein
MEHEHRDTRLNYDYSVATYFQRKHAYTETPLCAIHLTVLHYYIFYSFMQVHVHWVNLMK